MVCVSLVEDVCGIVQADSCCGEPTDQECPPLPDGEDCCVDVLPPTAAETGAVRPAPSREASPVKAVTLPSAMLPIPPPVAMGSEGVTHRRFDSGPPPDLVAVVRSTRLLL